MSWQVYLDDHLMCDKEGKHLVAAAIVGYDRSVWAQSPNFPQFKLEEFNAITKEFEQPGSLGPTCLFLGGTKYLVIQGDAGFVIRAKGKKDVGGVITVKLTSMSLIVGISDDNMTPHECTMVVERLGDYLIKQGL